MHGRYYWMCEAQWFAEAGFAVVIADGRGTSEPVTAGLLRLELAFFQDNLRPR